MDPSQGRIQDFPEGTPTYYLANFPESCMKMKKIGPTRYASKILVCRSATVSTFLPMWSSGKSRTTTRAASPFLLRRFQVSAQWAQKLVTSNTRIFAELIIWWRELFWFVCFFIWGRLGNSSVIFLTRHICNIRFSLLNSKCQGGNRVRLL